MRERLIRPSADYHPEIANAVWSMEDARQRTKETLEGLTTPNIIDWRSLDTPNSIGTILYHLVAIEMDYLYLDILEVGWADELEPLLPYDVRNAEGQLMPVSGESLDVHCTAPGCGAPTFLGNLPPDERRGVPATADSRRLAKLAGVGTLPPDAT